MKAIRMTHTGGPEVLQWTEVDDPSPAGDEVVVEVAAAGLNFIDTYHRTGLYPVQLPFIPGLEGAGTVVEVGTDVSDFNVGDTVAWSGSPGTYAERVALRADQVVPVPDGVDLDQAAAVMLQGMTAHYLVKDTFPLGEGDKCLIHAGAGGVGLLLIQMAKMCGATVFSTVGSPEKAALAEAAGADHVVLYRDVDFADEIEKVAGVRGLDVVYDGVGKTVFTKSLTLIRARGMMATFGNASGPVDPISPLDLAPSLFLTRPSLFHYIATREELLGRSGDIFEWISAGKLNVRIGARVPVSEAASAHEMLEGRQTTGKVILHHG
ncbi:MAG: quinone oxidoreductase [Acidimicrobiales bacterium]|nr:quinone oxidoreductase [Acidimicrobiales bacterium]